VYVPKNCNDGDPCTSDRCLAASGCENQPACQSGYQCCPAASSSSGIICCPGNGVCCNDPDHCCDAGKTCCPGGTQCCNPDQTCCNGVCGLKGACCFFDSGSCSELTASCCQQQGGTYLGDGTACDPPDLCRPKCENCHSITGTFSECGHGMTGPCDATYCSRNNIDTVGCDPFWYRLGPPRCNTSLLSSGAYMLQEHVPLTNMSCAPTNPGGFHVWMTLYAGCGSQCVGENQNVRCDVPDCVGEPDEPPFPRVPTTACGCP